MFCPRCGKNAGEGTRFCGGCGLALHAYVMPQQPMVAQPAAFVQPEPVSTPMQPVPTFVQPAPVQTAPIAPIQAASTPIVPELMQSTENVVTEAPVVEQMAVEPIEEPVTEQAVEPIEEPVAEQAIEPVEEPVAEQAIEPVEEPVVEQAIEPVEEPVVEQAIEPAAESVTEQAIEPIEEQVAEQAEDPAMEQETEAPIETPIETQEAPAPQVAYAPAPGAVYIPNDAPIFNAAYGTVLPPSSEQGCQQTAGYQQQPGYQQPQGYQPIPAQANQQAAMSAGMSVVAPAFTTSDTKSSKKSNKVLQIILAVFSAMGLIATIVSLFLPLREGVEQNKNLTVVKILEHQEEILIAIYVCFALLAVAVIQRMYKIVMAGSFFSLSIMLGMYIMMYVYYFQMRPEAQRMNNVSEWSIGFFVNLAGSALMFISSLIGVSTVKEPLRDFVGRKRKLNAVSVFLYAVLGIVFLVVLGGFADMALQRLCDTSRQTVGIYAAYYVKDFMTLLVIGLCIGLVYPLARVAFKRVPGAERKAMNRGLLWSFVMAFIVGALFIKFHRPIYEWVTKDSVDSAVFDIAQSYFMVNIFELLFMVPFIYLALAYIIKGKIGASFVWSNVLVIIKILMRHLLMKERFFRTPEGCAVIDLIACATAAILFIFYFVNEKKNDTYVVNAKVSGKNTGIGMAFAVVFAIIFAFLHKGFGALSEFVISKTNDAEVQTASIICRYSEIAIVSVLIVIIVYLMQTIKNKNNVS